MSYISDVVHLPKTSILVMNGGHTKGIKASNTELLSLETVQKE